MQGSAGRFANARGPYNPQGEGDNFPVAKDRRVPVRPASGKAVRPRGPYFDQRPETTGFGMGAGPAHSHVSVGAGVSNISNECLDDYDEAVMMQNEQASFGSFDVHSATAGVSAFSKQQKDSSRTSG